MSSQVILDIQVQELLVRVSQMKEEGCRLVQICCTTLPDHLELQYSFDKDFQYKSFRVSIPDVSVSIPSISGIYWGAFLYENELHDLFGLEITNIAIDYQGAFYRTAVKTPFNPSKASGEVVL